MPNDILVGSAIVLAAVACHGSGAGKTASVSATQAAVPCAVAVDGQDVSAWETVAATGFTFCAPPGWSARGNSIRRGGAVVRWGTGEHPRTEVTTVARRVPAGVTPVVGDPSPGSEVHRFNEVIGGLPVELWRNRFGFHYYTGAQWDAPGVWLVGETSDLQTANLQLSMYRTVSFKAP